MNTLNVIGASVSWQHCHMNNQRFSSSKTGFEMLLLVYVISCNFSHVFVATAASNEIARKFISVLCNANQIECFIRYYRFVWTIGDLEIDEIDCCLIHSWVCPVTVSWSSSTVGTELKIRWQSRVRDRQRPLARKRGRPDLRQAR